MKTLSVLIAFLLIISSCAVPRNIAQTDIDENSPQYKLVEARQTLSKGNFGLAEEMYLTVYNDTTYDPVFREEALFNLGMMYSDDAVSIEEYEIALDYLRQLSDEFPRTQYKEKTNREIRYIRNQIKRMKQNEN